MKFMITCESVSKERNPTTQYSLGRHRIQDRQRVWALRYNIVAAADLAEAAVKLEARRNGRKTVTESSQSS
jgi:hypothetical protein